ncbi:MAG TPA: DUF1553 domain-containing protein [Armatimonadota bacterium]|nr:DUF1553 domain-containing protein [Armatimonadota bacterium]
MIRPCLAVVTILVALHSGQAADSQPTRPFETDTWSTPANEVDALVLAALQAKGIEPAYPCSDGVFIRRVYLDVIGTLPEPADAVEFLQDDSPDKRATLIEDLLNRDEFADYWSLKWCDLLRVKAEFPINLWPNAVQAYHRWIREAVKENRPYDEFVRGLLTSNGSNFRVPPVNFYRAVQGREPAGYAAAVALTFMGTRVANWPEARREGMATFFSRVAMKKTEEWKEEIVYLDLEATEPIEGTFPDGTTVTIGPDDDPREVFADWLITPENPWFTRNIANRVWTWLMGRGIVHEPDDMRDDNPPVNPELLSYLEDELVAAEYDLKHVYRLVLNSRTYQQSSIPRGDDPNAEAMHAHYPVRRLGAEVLVDALAWLGGTSESYFSAIPEPFTYIPRDHRTISLADGSITSPFLQMFGRPARDTGLESERNNQPSDAQRLYLLNSADVQRRVMKSHRLRRIAIAARGDRNAVVQGVYMALLSREPTPKEQVAAMAYYETPDLSADDAAVDLAWSLVNTMEFLYRH